ncbi:hypothetical protein C8N46_10723 [Kordia periserrulae]|uniref:Dockerin domain-containing protein n=2 Tax=Kordia periserrulae TaxID=701523 RepID=A0A2T6BVL0_9FLAO|nr:hypothetical protein C8N46_10723 [Kordia periserrulae]
MTSCSHENSASFDESTSITKEVLKNYPKEITIDNWQQFVTAPKEVIEYFTTKEEKPSSKPNEFVEKDGFGNSFSSLEFGKIQVQNGGSLTNNWLGNTRISTYNFSDLNDELGHTLSEDSNFGNDSNYFFSINTSTDVMCFFYDDITNEVFSGAQWRNGISVLDLVLIARHVEQIECFEGAWQFLAADANGDGAINELDTNVLQNLILYEINELPEVPTSGYNQPVIYFPQETYAIFQNFITINPCTFDESLFVPFYEIISCQRISDEQFDRFAIKRGDVSGNWIF